MTHFELPPLVRRKVLAQGAVGERWLADLPVLVGGLEKDWRLRVGRVLSGGTEGLLLEAERDGGVSAVLKLVMPEVGSLDSEANVLRLADGQGYARLLDYDEGRNAMLLERLGACLDSMNLPVTAQIKIICETLKTAWRPVTAPHGLMAGGEKARWLADFTVSTWEDLERPVGRPMIDQAVAYADARQRAHDPAACVLVHGDAHAHNTLQRPDGAGFKFIDPDGLVAEPACDLAVPMREWGADLLAGDALALGQERCVLLSRLCDVDAPAIWQWGFMERVSTGLLFLKLGETDLAWEFLNVAEHWTGADM